MVWEKRLSGAVWFIRSEKIIQNRIDPTHPFREPSGQAPEMAAIASHHIKSPAAALNALSALLINRPLCSIKMARRTAAYKPRLFTDQTLQTPVRGLMVSPSPARRAKPGLNGPRWRYRWLPRRGPAGGPYQLCPIPQTGTTTTNKAARRECRRG